MALVLLLGAAGLAIAHAAALRDVERFEAVATRTVGTVTDPGVDDPLVVEVAGRSYEVGVTIESYSQSESVPVLIDFGTGQVALVAEPIDPSWLLGWAAVAVVVSGCAWTTLWSRGRRRVSLLRDGGPAVELFLLRGSFTLLSDTASFDSQRQLVIGELMPVELAFVEEPHEGPPPRRALVDDSDPARLEEHHRSPVQISDTEVQAWANQLNTEDDEEVGPEDYRPEVAQPRQVTVIGPLVDGLPVLVRDGHRLLLTTRPVRDPWMLRRLPNLLLGRPDEGSSPTEGHQRTPAPWVAPLSLPLAYLLAVPGGFGLWWLFDDPAVPLTWGDAIPLAGVTFALAAGLHHLADKGLAVLSAHPNGLQLRGPLLTTVLPTERVIDVVTARQSIVLRLRTPDDLVDIDAAAVAGDGATPVEAGDRVRHRLAQTDKAAVRWPHRPSPSLGPPALLLLTLAASAINGL